ncbi:MAG: VOC family protein [Pseudomonadales bacterium]|nr:VOC family protein [Pseudomonadales bacterium]
MNLTPFHLAIPVRNKEEAKCFYLDVLSCSLGREGEKWIDLNLYGHQLVCHEIASGPQTSSSKEGSNPVDGHNVPIPHFGVVLELDEWKALAQKLVAAEVDFIIEPYIRFAGKAGEQGTLFFRDPSGNAIEFKGFKNIEAELFQKDDQG